MSDEEDPSGELIRICENDPVAGLAWIERLDEELRAHPRIRFAAFLAHRALCFSRFFADGQSSLSGKGRSDYPQWFGPDEVASGERALKIISQIEADEPDYLPSLDFAEGMIDQVATVVNVLVPGRAQEVLGWTKINYFDSSRIFIPKPVEEILGPLPKSLSSLALESRLAPEAIAKSAMIGHWNTKAPRSVSVIFMRESVRDHGTVEAAGSMKMITINEPVSEPGLLPRPDGKGCAVLLAPLLLTFATLGTAILR